MVSFHNDVNTSVIAATREIETTIAHVCCNSTKINDLKGHVTHLNVPFVSVLEHDEHEVQWRDQDEMKRTV
jgi:hypothetical protein